MKQMEVKFKKYWKKNPYLYYFSFNLDSRMKFDKFYDILTFLGKTIDMNYLESHYVRWHRKTFLSGL